MKIKIYTLLLSVILVFPAARGQYCNPSYTNMCTTSIASDFVNNFSTTGGEVNISNLNSGCSGSPGNYIYYSNMKVSAYPGNTINFSVNNGANPFGGTNWEDGFGIWVDWNQDYTFDASEFVWNSVVAADYQTVFTGSIVVPANAKPGITRMRVMDVFDNPPTQAQVCGSILYGECEDYNFEVLNVSGPKFDLPPIANFAYDEGIDTVWVNSPYNFVNTSSQDSVHYWDITPLNGLRTCNTPGFGCYLSSDRNYRKTFTQTGEYLVKLMVGNKIGKDSIVKRIIVANQTRKPVVQFYFDKQTMGIGQQVQGYDYSHYGPTGWEWTIKPLPNTNTFLPNKNDPMPRFSGMQIGTFDVCLKVWNPIGADSICKAAHIQVTSGNTMCLADSVSTDLNGYLYSNRGPVDSYDPSAMSANCGYLINPCATAVVGYIEKLNLRKSDTLIFRDGDVTGSVIRKLGGSNITAGQRTITASSGRLYVQWKLSNTNPINGGDSGFVMKWTSTAANYTVPNALFTSPDTIYSTQNLVYNNKTVGQGLLQYTWDADGDGTFGDFTSATGANWTFVTSQPLVKNICLQVTNCKGTSQYCKQLTILPIVQKPEANFTANMVKGFTTDNFKLYDQSRNGVGSWNWSISPAADASFVQGTTPFSQNPVVKLSKPGYYTITLTAGNSEGINTLTRTDYIQVLRYEEPNTEYPIATGSDIGITRVRFANVDTSTAAKSPIYDKIYEKKTGVLYRGVNYQLIVSRTTGVSGMERKVWIDKDLDGLFNGASETLISETNTNNTDAIASFMIPNDIEPGRFTRLRVGISEGNTTLTPDKATSGCFEDYGAEIGLDETPPVISLIGSNLYRVEIHKPFIDPGVSAIDNLEGQIGYRAEVISNLDTGKAGIYTIKYTVKDLYGNVSDTAYRTVQMEINRTGPVITLIGPDTQYVEVFDNYIEAGATATDNTGKSLDSALHATGFVDTWSLGTYYITYEVTDQFSYTTTRKRVVIVRDTEAPLITTTYGGPVIRHQIGTPYLDRNIILIDNYYSREELTVIRTGTINTNKGGTYYLRYNVCDPSHNCTGDYFVQVEVEDTIPPLAQLLGDNPLTIDVFEPYTDPGVIATDNYYSQASLIVIKTNNIQIGNLGEYMINYTVRDGAGNETKLSRYVEVADRKKPEIEILNNPFELVRFKDYEEPGIRIHDNYYSHEELIDKVMISTNLGVRNDTLWGELPGWKYIRYQVRDLSGNLSEVYERQVKVVEMTGLTTHTLSKNVSIYPNPNNGKFTLGVTEELKGKATVTLYNTLGAKVYSQELDTTTDTHTITTNGLAAGVYLIEVKTAGQQLLQRVIIK
jgi:PKD repeat protein